MAPFDTMLTASQRKVLHEDGCSDSKPMGLDYRSPSDDEGPSTINMVVAEEDSSSGEEIEVETPTSKEEEVRPAPLEFEEGGQATVDELREVNLGMTKTLVHRNCRGTPNQRRRLGLGSLAKAFRQNRRAKAPSTTTSSSENED